ncbi:MAG: glutathione S-transferase family protein [Deltaproteobacteria bacterium]|nr:glutathione S-transferase family protein [Deltaproteobacteria bacterium]
MAETDTIVLTGRADNPSVRALVGILRSKGLEHRLEPPAAGPITVRVFRDVDGQDTRLRVGGRVVTGSRAIRDFLEDHHPQPALRPRDISAAAWCHVLEDWAEEALAWRVLALRWLVPASREAAAAAFVSGVPGILRPLASRGAAAAMSLRLRGRGISPADVPEVEHALARDLDELDRLLHDRDWLLGEPHGRTTADLVVASHLAALDGTAYEESVRARRSLVRWLRETRRAWE